jgi:hypothetical protein
MAPVAALQRGEVSANVGGGEGHGVLDLAALGPETLLYGKYHNTQRGNDFSADLGQTLNRNRRLFHPNGDRPGPPPPNFPPTLPYAAQPSPTSNDPGFTRQPPDAVFTDGFTIVGAVRLEAPTAPLVVGAGGQVPGPREPGNAERRDRR